MSDTEPVGGSFREYRQLILAHIESSNRRQDAIEDAITEMKVQMGVLLVKVSLIVATIVLVVGTAATVVVSAAVKGAAAQVVEDARDEG